MNTPWGRSNTQREIAEGITRVTTPRHGGFRLDDARWQELETVFPDFVSFAGEKWLEEDCDWAIAYAVWPEAFTGKDCLPESNYPQAVKTLIKYLKVPEPYWDSERGQRLLAMTHRNIVYMIRHQGEHYHPYLMVDGRYIHLYVDRMDSEDKAIAVALESAETLARGFRRNGYSVTVAGEYNDTDLILSNRDF